MTRTEVCFSGPIDFLDPVVSTIPILLRAFIFLIGKF